MPLCRSLVRPPAVARLSTARHPAAPVAQARTTSPIRRLYATQREDFSEFKRICESGRATREDFPLATDIQLRVPIYDSDSILSSPPPAALSELHAALEGPGVFVLRGAVSNAAVLRDTTAVFDEIIAREKKGRTGFADHFAASGANDRIWNSFQKAAESSPKNFVEYFSSPAIALACRAWLGPGYQITAQVNNVLPGGAAQEPHRDYHLGFCSDTVAALFPLATHITSQYLTLQGAVAHSDMPLASGPTQFLPFSQQFKRGYLKYRQPDFIEYFSRNYIQLPLAPGDAVFFNPGLHHAAGTNTMRSTRSANLLQISSALGRAMESVDRSKVAVRTWGALQDLYESEGKELSPKVQAAVSAIGEGYSFPTNLETDQPVGGLSPQTQQEILIKGLEESWDQQRLEAEIAGWEKRRLA